MNLSHCLLFATVLSCLLALPSRGVEEPATPAVRVTVDTAVTINVMRGGIGASWHAIEQPIPYSDKPRPRIRQQEPRRQRLGGLSSGRGRRRLATDRASRPLAGPGLEPRRVGAADLRARARPIQLGQPGNADLVSHPRLVRKEEGRRVLAANVGQRPLEHLPRVARRSAGPGPQRPALDGGFRRGPGHAGRAPGQDRKATPASAGCASTTSPTAAGPGGRGRRTSSCRCGPAWPRSARRWTPRASTFRSPART